MKRVFVIILLWLFVVAANAADESILVSAKINNKPVRFIFDTGCKFPVVLFPAAAKKLGLKFTPPDYQHDKMPVGTTELCDLDFSNTHVRTSVGILDSPDYYKWNADGIIGWPAFSQNIFCLDAAKREIILLTNVPAESLTWTKLRIKTDPLFILEIPDARSTKFVSVDTGKDRGIVLNPKKWQEWKAAHANQPTTLDASYMPVAGLVVKEESFARQISLGPLEMTDVPIMESNQHEMAVGSQFEATLGVAALERLDIIIDGKDGFAYLRPKKTPPLPYEHNRLGAVFVPRDLQGDDAIAHVAENSPAFDAGIRSGDVLLKIGELDVTKWRTDPNVLPLSRFWDSPAGTKLEFTLKRDDIIFKATATLRNILPPDSK